MAGSQVFVGRAHQLAGLRSAFRGHTRLVLVVADAGVGKTRLVTEGLRLATADGLLSAWGACLPLAEKLPLLPVAEALAELGRIGGGTAMDRALGLIPPYARAEAARLLPRLDPAATPPDGQAGGWRRERLFAGVAELLAGMARDTGLVLVIDDVHWADSATLDFLTFLARTGRGEGTTVVATCRSDESPLEPHVTRWLAHTRSDGHVEEIRLPPLSRDEVAAQTASLTGGHPPPGLADQVYARGEGNPFFTEQLVADAVAGPVRWPAMPGQPAPLPGRLADLLAGRAAGCGQDARAVLAALAVAGRPLTEEQLAEVAGLEAGAMRAGLRELGAAQLLAEHGADGRHRPRHALLAEAVAGGLLPGEQRALHERTAQALEAAGDEALAAEAADHWAAAGRSGAELRARVTAASNAERVFGYTQAAVHWRRAIGLAQAGPGAADSIKLSPPELYVRAIDALALSGDAEQACWLAEEAYQRFAGHPDPALDAVIHERAARFRGLAQVFVGADELLGPVLPPIGEALRLFEAAGPSAQYAEALFYHGNFLLYSLGQAEEALCTHRRGLAMAEAAGATALVPRFLGVLAFHEFLTGHMGDGFALLRRGRALAEASRDGEAGIQLDNAESIGLLGTAHYAEAADLALRGLQAARRTGLAAYFTAGPVATHAAEALIMLGRTAEAAAVIDPLTTSPPDRAHWTVHIYRAEIDVLRGDHAAAAQRLRQVTNLVRPAGNFSWSRDKAQRVMEAALWAGRPEQTLAEFREEATVISVAPWAAQGGRMFMLAMQACADLTGRGRARHDEAAAGAAAARAGELESLLARLDGMPFGEHPFVATAPAERAGWDAERTRLAGAGDPTAWAAAATAWSDLGCPHQAGYAWWRRGEALLDRGATRDAAGALRAGARAAAGHAPLLAQIRTLARRARIPLGPVDAARAGPQPGVGPAGDGPAAGAVLHGYGLTERETLVLRLLVAGRTNAQIGAELFISPKTASVHVTSILRKLGVAGRVQAAALAERAGLLDREPG